jgi:3-methyladenine DNA glycosylase/8-oxoguanine DNA glycosylase
VNFTHILTLHPPRDFAFWRTAYSHGWCDLLPFSFDAARQELGRILSLEDGTVVGCLIQGSARGVRVRLHAPRRLHPGQILEIRSQIRTCLRFDDDLAPFHMMARSIPEYRWIASVRAGRLLRAPTMFEDAVKMICTTNCTWNLTVIMVRALVERFGISSGDGTAFPAPAAIAAATEGELRRSCSTGYRARALLELAVQVSTGKLDIERWRISEDTTEQLFDEMCGVRGIGPYAAGNLLKLVGRYDYLGLDSWVRKQYAFLHTRGRRVKDATIERRYAPFGRWRGLVFWLEMTRDWHDEKFGRPATDHPSVT